MLNFDRELTMKNCAYCGQKIIIIKKFVKPKIYCTIKCMDADNMNANEAKEIKA